MNVPRDFGLEVPAREHDGVWPAAASRARPGLWLPGEEVYGDEGGRHAHFASRSVP